MKHELSQTIFYFRENKLHSAKVLSRKLIENMNDDQVSNPQQKELYQPWGESSVVYSTCHGEVNEKDAYSSKEELLNSLGK